MINLLPWRLELTGKTVGRHAALLFALAIFVAPAGWAQNADRTADGPVTVIGPRNPELKEGADRLLLGHADEGVRLTLRGLRVAQGAREEEAALSNLCAGYIMLKNYDEALKYCDLLLTRNDRNWRGYNNRAVVYINTEQYDKAHADLLKGEELNPGARTLRIARAMYLDAVEPVEPEVEIDDRQRSVDEQSVEH
jgi:tetratricopeptide (TPR) repeat protein